MTVQLTLEKIESDDAGQPVLWWQVSAQESNTHLHAYARAYMCVHARLYVYAEIQTHPLTHTHTSAYTHTQAHKHTRTKAVHLASHSLPPFPPIPPPFLPPYLSTARCHEPF